MSNTILVANNFHMFSPDGRHGHIAAHTWDKLDGYDMGRMWGSHPFWSSETSKKTWQNNSALVFSSVKDLQRFGAEQCSK
jgi:hypothetical protein